MQNSQPLFSNFPEQPPSSMSKKGFAEHVGVTQGRISQLIAQGLPVEPSGRIDVTRGVAWLRANIDSNRRRADLPGEAATPFPTAPLSPQGAKTLAEARIAELKAERLAGSLLNRRAALRVVEGRAKAERDAWIGWVNRAAPAIAAAVDGDLSMITAILDREVREQLATLAQQPLELPR